MTKRGKIIIGALLLLATILLAACSAPTAEKNPGLTSELKASIVAEYKEHWLEYSSFDIDPIIWYDENNGVEEEHVWHYIGTYGDCVALLRLLDGYVLDSNMPVELPYRVKGLLVRPVYYHWECDVFLYNIKETTTEYGKLAPIGWKETEHWLTEGQLNQLADDIEALSKLVQQGQ